MNIKLLGKIIKSERQLNNMNQEELAKEVDISLFMLRRYEQCLQLPTLDVFTKISNVLGFTLEEVLEKVEKLKE